MSKPADIAEPGPLLPAQRERPPVAGFWIRCIAFILDVILLHFVAYAMVFAFKEQLLGLGKLAPYVGLAFVFCYFWLANGPVGKGKTIGKSLFNITTLRYDGQPLEMKDALIRALVQLSVLLVQNLILPFLLHDVRSQSWLMITHLVMNLAFAFLIANAVLIGVQPFKQGFHDLLARSYVAKDPTRLTEETIVATADERMARWRRSAFQSAGIAFVVVLVISLYQAYRNVYSEGMVKGIRLTREARELFEIEGFELDKLGATELPQEKEASARPAARRQPLRREDTVTSPVAPGAKPKQYAFVFLYVRYASVDAELLKHDRYITVLLEDAKRWVIEKMDTDLHDMYEKGVVPEKVMFIFKESLNLVIYVYEKQVYEASLPLELTPKKSPSAGTQSKAAQHLSSFEPLTTDQ